MRASLRSLVAATLGAGLAACADSPVAPTPTVGDRLAAVADSTRGHGDPFAVWLGGAAQLVARVPSAQPVSIVVDGVAQPFQAVVVETSIPVPDSLCLSSTGYLCGAGSSAASTRDIDTRTLFAFDAAMQRFVSVTVTTLGPSTDRRTTAFGIYAERGAGGAPAATFFGVATATPDRVSTGAKCPGRAGAGALAASSCVAAQFDFAFAFDARAEQITTVAGALVPTTRVVGAPDHTLRMSTSRVAGQFLTLAPFTGMLPFFR